MNEYYLTITENEFYLLCDLYNGILPAADKLNCKLNLLGNLNDYYYYDGNSQWAQRTNQDILSSKIANMSYKEILELLILIAAFWTRPGDEPYRGIDFYTPHQALAEYLEAEKYHIFLNNLRKAKLD